MKVQIVYLAVMILFEANLVSACHVGLLMKIVLAGGSTGSFCKSKRKKERKGKWKGQMEVRERRKLKKKKELKKKKRE